MVTYLSRGPERRPAFAGRRAETADLAKTLEALAAEGPGLMYGGALGKKVIERLVELGGCLTMEDLLDTKAVWIDPVAASYAGAPSMCRRPPCEAFQYLLTLRILEGFELGKMPRNGTEHIDTVLRAIRVAAACASPTASRRQQKLAELLSDGHVESLRRGCATASRSMADRAMDGARFRGPQPRRSRSPTRGNMVCVTQSLGSVFVRRGRARHRGLPQQLPLLGPT